MAASALRTSARLTGFGAGVLCVSDAAGCSAVTSGSTMSRKAVAQRAEVAPTQIELAHLERPRCSAEHRSTVRSQAGTNLVGKPLISGLLANPSRRVPSLR